MAYTKADLKHDLAAMGLTGNETILIHSSMKSIGPVEGGAARNTKFGDASCVLCDAEGLFRVTRHVLAPNPEAFVTEPVIPPERWQEIIL